VEESVLTSLQVFLIPKLRPGVVVVSVLGNVFLQVIQDTPLYQSALLLTTRLGLSYAQRRHILPLDNRISLNVAPEKHCLQ
jgi:hypothetical protein